MKLGIKIMGTETSFNNRFNNFRNRRFTFFTQTYNINFSKRVLFRGIDFFFFTLITTSVMHFLTVHDLYSE